MMKIACISASTVPSGTANSIQAMKVCQSLVQIGSEVRLWLPGSRSTPWETLAEQYGLETPFAIDWLVANLRLRRYDFAWNALRAARAWRADAVYTWVPQAGLLALWAGMPMLLELHDRPTGRVGPWLFRQIARHPGKKRLLFITQAHGSIPARRRSACKFAASNTGVVSANVTSNTLVCLGSCSCIIGVT